MLSFPVDPKEYKRRMYPKYLGLIGLLQILSLTIHPTIVIPAEKLEIGTKVAILPFENMSGYFVNIDEVMKRFYQNLDMVFTLSSIDKVDEVIWELRLRHTGFLSSKEALEIGNRLGVKAIILGMICSYKEIPEPRIGLIMKVIRTGEGTPLLWSASINRSGNLTESWFGLNRISNADSLIDEVAQDMIKEIRIHLTQKGDNFK